MIDLRDPASFDPEIRAHLDASADIIRAFMQNERERDERYERGLDPIRTPNPHYDAWDTCREGLADLCRTQDILAFHYSRLTDREVDQVLTHGFQPTSLKLLRQRLTGQIEEGNLTSEAADAIFISSPLHSPAYGVRLNLFWMTSLPAPIAGGGVSPLLGQWGGEAVYWCIEGELAEAVSQIGRPRVFSIRLPLASTEHDSARSIANYIARLEARSLGFDVYPEATDLCVSEPVAAERIIAVASEGDGAFEALDQSAQALRDEG